MSIRINFSETEGGMGIIDPLPTGKYHVKVTDGEIRESGPAAKNPGSEYINWEFTVQDGPYENRKVWTNTTLLPHALFALKGLLGACGFDVTGNIDFDIDDVIGTDVIVRVTKKAARTLDDGREVDESNDVKGFAVYKEDAVASSGSGSLLP